MNKLTEKLFSEGYTKENHPDYVEWSNYKDFEYTREYLAKSIWETPCGLLKNGIHTYSNGSHMGVEYCPENNNPRFGCPYFDEIQCPHRINTNLLGWNCIYNQSDRPYNYDQSVEKIFVEWDEIRSREHNKIMAEYGYCACMKWDRYARRYRSEYDVDDCIRTGCKNEVCAITKKQRNLEKVNIFYDILRIRKYKMGLVEMDDKQIEKGVKVFESAITKTDAEIWLKMYSKENFQVKHNKYDRRDLHFSEYHGKTGFDEYDWFEFTITPQNIRIEKRESRDLLQDLRDAQEGIEVIHASDLQKAAKQAKKDRKESRQKANERKIIKNMKNLLNSESELLKIFAEKELKRRGVIIEKELEQISMF